MARVQQGDTEAFQRLVEAHQVSVIGTIAKMLSDEMDAEDLAQQAFIQVWRSAPRYVPTGRFAAWLFRIVRNLVFTELRRRGRRGVLYSLDAEPENGFAPMQFADRSSKAPDAAVIELEAQKSIQAAIDQLPEKQRMAIILRAYQQFSYEEIAEVLDMTVPLVKSLLFRARTNLREILRPYLRG